MSEKEQSEKWYGMVQIRAYLSGIKYIPHSKAPWVDYGTGDTKPTTESVAAPMRKGGFKTRILKNGDPRILRSTKPQ